jgi:hypothetical protein
LPGKSKDVSGYGGGLDAFEFGVHSDDRPFPHTLMANGPLMRGGPSVMFLTYFRPVTLFEDQFLLGQKIVCEDPVEFGKSR